MPDELRLAAGFLLAATAALACTPLAIAVATRTGFNDKPVGYKGHKAPTPYLGGAAVVTAFLIGGATFGGELSRLGPIVIIAFGFWCLGTIDDKLNLSPQLRLVIGFGAASALWVADLGWSVTGSPVLDLLLTNVWVVGLVNAFNLMDNMDGAAATVGAVTTAATGALALSAGDAELATLCLCMTGACLGFLPYNLAGPARIFLGDGGSLPVGFVVAATIMAAGQGSGSGWAMPLAALILAGLPVVDTALVMISRRRAGVALLTGGRDHMTHRLATRLGSPRVVAGVLGSIQAVLGAVAVGVVELGTGGSVVSAWTVWFVAATAAIVMLETRTWAPMRPPAQSAAEPEAVTAPERAAVAARAARSPGSPRSPTPVEAGAILFITIACGLSPALYGFYRVGVWGPIALFMLAILLALAIARPAAPTRRALVALGGLAGLWLWSLASGGWALSADQALTGANRWLLYLALFGVLVLLLREDRLSVLLVGSAAGAVLAFGLYLSVRLLGPGGPGMFLGERLNEPLGYVNGQAGYLLIGVWPFVALAERARSHLVAGGAIAAATLLAGLALFGQTRAVIPAALASLVILVLVLPGRVRRVWALMAVAVGVVIALGSILDVFDSVGAAAPGPAGDTLRAAVVALLVASVVAGAIFAAGSWLAARAGERVDARSLRLASGGLAAGIVVLVVIAGLIAVGNPGQRVQDQWDAFRSPGAATAVESRSRFTSGAGNRYEYWRVAWNQVRDEPVRGVGAGNFDSTWFLQRRVTEDVRQAHSIELQTLGELGVVGGAALLLFVGALLAGFVVRARRARTSPRDLGLAVAGGGMFLVWLVHTSVDWLHLIPGITGIALCGAAVLVAPWRRERGRDGLAPLRLAGIVAVVAVALVGAVLIGRTALADRQLADARGVLDSDPRAALADTADSLDLNDEHMDTYYVRASAFARLDDYPKARATLLEATRKDPGEFVTWGLVGDLAVRRGELRQARAAYRRASALNPRDRALRSAAQDPRRLQGSD